VNAVEERGDRVVFNIKVTVPLRQAPIFAEHLTGDDNDIILAAEEALREAIEDEVIDGAKKMEDAGRTAEFDLADRIELDVRSLDIVREILADAMRGRS